MPKKRIAVITARVDYSEQQAVLGGIAEAAFSLDCDVAVFSNTYDHWHNNDYLNYENIIYDLFSPSLFDGVIITAEAFKELSVLDDVIAKIRESGIPAVTIGEEMNGFLSVPSDDDEGMQQIAEHIIAFHGFRNIDILAGKKGEAVSELRLSGCRRAFEKYGIPFDESRVHHGNFWTDSGKKLAERYLSGELEMPQAVICTNDYMAYGLCDALTDAGIEIPEQISVTGYDNTDSRILHYPFLTTYRRYRREMGARAVGTLLKTEVRLPDDCENIIYGNTCPCGVKSAQLRSEISSLRPDLPSASTQFTGLLTLCQTLSEYTSALKEYLYFLPGISKLYLCLDKAWNSTSYEGEEFLCCGIDWQSHSEAPIRFPSGVLLPALYEEQAEPAIYYFNPLYFQTRLFGYTVLCYNTPKSYDSSFRDWSKTAANMLEFLRMKNDIHYLVHCQHVSALYDSLTGFYNMREFRRIIETVGSDGHWLFAVNLSFAAEGEFKHGENYRSEIVSAVAGAIKQAGVNHEIFCRSKDEQFLILSKNSDGLFLDRLKALIHHSICAKYDETVVTVAYAEQKGVSESDPAAICRTVERLALELSDAARQRASLLHYSVLLEIHKSIRMSPKSAPSTDELAKRLCVSDGYFRAIYKKCFGMSYNQDSIDSRIMLAKYLLFTTSMSIYSIAITCGYSDEKFFARQFRQSVGCSPMQYRGRT